MPAPELVRTVDAYRAAQSPQYAAAVRRARKHAAVRQFVRRYGLPTPGARSGPSGTPTAYSE